MPKYSSKASAKVAKVMHERKAGTLKSGSTGKKVTSRKQAIAIAISEARRAGLKVPPAKKPRAKTKATARKKTPAKRATTKKQATAKKKAPTKKKSAARK